MDDAPGPLTTATSTCSWCSNLARYRVSSIRRDKPHGGHWACGRHLTRAVDYVTVPGSHANVERVD